MDKNTVIGLLLIGAILIGYTYLNKPSQEEIEAQRRKRDSITRVQAEQQKQQQQQAQEEQQQEQENLAESQQNQATPDSLLQDSTLSDSVIQAQTQSKFGAFAKGGKGQQQFITLENQVLKITFTNKGARPYAVELKKFTRYDSSQVILFDGNKTDFRLNFALTDDKIINTQEMFFEPQTQSENIDASNSAQTLKMRLKAEDGKYIEYAYTLEPESYMLDFDINFQNLGEIIDARDFIDFTWQIDVPRQEKGLEWENNNTSIFYKFFEDDVDWLSERSDDEQEDLTTRLKWVAFKQHFFSSVLIAENHFEGAKIQHQVIDTSENYVKNFDATITMPYAGTDNEKIDMKLYFGPNKYSLLKSYEMNMEEMIFLGRSVFRWVNRYAIIPLFNWLGKFINSYGIVILILTIIIKLVLFPLTYRSYLSSAKMRVLKPQIDKINEKIPKEKNMERQQAMMSLYKKAGVNPMGGCLPILLQMPILIAMFRFFPSSIELRHEKFLWADDLSTYDSILDLPFTIPFYGDHVSLFTLLMAAAIVLSTKMNSQASDANAQMPGMKYMMYLMPVMMVFWFNSYSSGLSYYYLLSNIITMIQMLAIRRFFIDDQAVLKKLEAHKKKAPKKKSNFQKRLEDAAKQRGYKPPKR